MSGVPAQNRRTAPAEEPGTDIRIADEIATAGGIAPFMGKLLKPIARVVPEHVNPEAFIALALAAVNRDERLLGASLVNPASLVYAMRYCAVLGHLPVRGSFVFVAYRNKNAIGGWEVVGIEEYRGVIERMYRGGGVASVHARVVREYDTFALRDGLVPTHKFDLMASDKERGKLAGVYAYARLNHGGLSEVVWMNKHEVKKHKDSSKSGEAFWGTWDCDVDKEARWAPDMWLKTALHKLERFVPTSSAWRAEAARVEAAATRPGAFPVIDPAAPPKPPGGDDLIDGHPDVHDAVIVDERPAEPVSGPSGDGDDDRGWPEAAVPGGGGTR